MFWATVYVPLQGNKDLFLCPVIKQAGQYQSHRLSNLVGILDIFRSSPSWLKSVVQGFSSNQLQNLNQGLSLLTPLQWIHTEQHLQFVLWFQPAHIPPLSLLPSLHPHPHPKIQHKLWSKILFFYFLFPKPIIMFLHEVLSPLHFCLLFHLLKALIL